MVKFKVAPCCVKPIGFGEVKSRQVLIYPMKGLWAMVQWHIYIFVMKPIAYTALS